MNLLADMTSHVQAHLVSTQRPDALGSERTQFLFSASFDEEKANQGGCQWDFLLDSKHIEFMLQEPLHFVVQHQLSSGDNTLEATQTHTSRRLFYDEDGEDSYEPNLGDIRILADSDTDNEDEDEKRELQFSNAG